MGRFEKVLEGKGGVSWMFGLLKEWARCGKLKEVVGMDVGEEGRISRCCDGAGDRLGWWER